jgi:RNA polymerase sigma-70 factor (ECF subfamily)
VFFGGEVADDQLRMVFTCCHPAVPREARVALTLKTAGGFGVPEIARAYLAREAAVAQRLVRAKRRIREAGARFEVPAGAELPERLDSVLEVLYLMFNEGYAAASGEAALRADVCVEAVRLAELVAAHPATGVPRAHALTALLLLQGARLPARTDAAGDPVLLAEQDRSRWDAGMLARGLAHLERAAEGDDLSPYHLEAGIAAVHATAPSYEATDWPYILGLYDALVAVKPSPVAALNRAVAVSMVHGPEAGLRAADEAAAHPSLAGYPLLHAVRGDLLARLGDPDAAAVCFRRALSLPLSAPDRRMVERRVRECESERQYGVRSTQYVKAPPPRDPGEGAFVVPAVSISICSGGDSPAPQFGRLWARLAPAEGDPEAVFRGSRSPRRRRTAVSSGSGAVRRSCPYELGT